MGYVLGIDLGSSYFKVLIVDKRGVSRGLGRVAVPVRRKGKNISELSVDAFWSALREAVRNACAAAEIEVSDVCAVSYASQANSFLLLDSEYTPLTPIILWSDTRSSKENSFLQELRQSGEYLQKTGMNFHGPEFCVSKIKWIQEHEPAVWSKTRHVMTISDYLTFMLTGEAMGDSGTASLLGIYNLEESMWWKKALSQLAIPEEYMSRLYRPGTVKGRTASSAHKYLGLKEGIPFALGGLDHHVAAIGAGAGVLSGVSESTGTVLACYQSNVPYLPDSSSCLGPAIQEGRYYRLRFNGNGAKGIEWYRDNFAQGYSLEELGELAAQVVPGCDGLTASPEAFCVDDLSRFTPRDKTYSQGHYIRALMESTAVSLLDILPHTSSVPGSGRILATGGGARSPLWLDIKAGVTGKELITTESPEPAAYGAAMLAAIAAGWFASVSDVSGEWVRVKKTYSATQELIRQYSDWLKYYRAVIV